MSIETLDGVKKLGDFEVVVMDDLREKYPERFPDGRMCYDWFEMEIRSKKFIFARRDKNSLSFTFQSGPIKEIGVDGCQVDVLAHALKHIITEFNKKYYSDYNLEALRGLDITIQALDDRTKSRKARGVEGYNKV